MQLGSLENIKFLVVDDNQFMRRIIKTTLAAFHCRNVKEAADGAEALRLLSSGYFPDILITNWQMPMIDGIDLSRMVRTGSDSRDPYVPIIMVTGHSEHNRIIEARDAGVNEILVKPISARTLTTRIFSVINHPRPFVRSGGYFGPDRKSVV